MPTVSQPPTSIPVDDALLKVAIAPIDIRWADRDTNLRLAEEKLDALKETAPDIVVFPELFTTSFVADTTLMEQLAESEDGPTMRWAARQAAQRNCAIAGSFLHKRTAGSKEEGEEKTAGGQWHFYNHGFIILPSGERVFYDKRHLFCLSPEARVFTQGQVYPPIIKYKGWRISLIVCYDLRFPVWDRSDMAEGKAYDLMLVPANWPTAREYAWKHLLIARAIENMTPYVGANRSGCDDFGDYGKTAYIFDAMGQPVGEEIAGCPVATLSLDTLGKSRRRLPVGNDADHFQVNL